ncbi:MAG: type VII secretion protein EssC [Chloroflexota bacterium]|nr:type VII secretion protein EssC [Chloroflexota bacterium]
MPTPPVFDRGPRQHPELPAGEIEIPAPTSAPTEPSFSWVSVLLPAGATVVGLGVMIAASASQGSNPLLVVGSATMMLASYSATLINHFVQKRAYRQKLQEREQKYQALLQHHRKELDGLRDQQRVALCQNDPAPSECLGIVERQERRWLWARAPGDDYFLILRLGLGKQAFRVRVKAPKQQSPLEPDPLIQAAQDMVTGFAKIPQVPIGLPLRQAGVAGLAGPRDVVLHAVRSLAIQIATHHSPHDVKIVAVYPAGEADDWDWLRWLPHVWSDDRNHRFLAREPRTAHDLLTSFYDLLNRRRLRAQSDRDSTSPHPLPYLVIFLADPRLTEGEAILPLLLRQGPALGAFPIFLADRVEALPKGCQAMAEVGPGQPRLTTRVPDSTSLPYTPDRSPRELAGRLSRTMAPIRMKLSTEKGIPTTVTLLEALGAERVEDLDILGNWKTNDPYRSMAVPLGMRTGGELQYLDLHEPGSKPDPQRGHGPNGLVAGTVGFGKSEILLSLIAGLAVNFHPHEVVFVLLDFKGGGMANAVQGLPHVVNAITNLELDFVPRALTSLEAEIEKRERLFEKAGVSHIDDYMALYRQQKVKEILPYLVLIVDEFTVLKDKRPEDMRRFVMVAVKGRALGFRMILATQKPAGVVSDQIDANTRFRLCLRVTRPEDSQEMIKRPDAASLTSAGQAFVRVGDDEVFELFQSAWSGAPYTPAGYVASDPHEIVEVTLDGSRHPLRLSPKPTVVQAAGKQLDAVIAHIQETAQREGILPLRRKPWLPPLPEQVTLEGVRLAEGWDGQTWQPASGWLAPVVGLVDDPAHQHQGPLRLDLGEGHLAAYGAPGTGKTTFVQTLITSLALTYSPRDVNLYLLDFGGRLLAMFDPLPHVGGVVLADEDEELDRLLGYLLREMKSRKNLFAEAGVGTLTAYRSATGESMPAIVVILDNYSGFDKKFPNPEDLAPWVQIFREGGNLGIHMVITANRPSAVKYKISGNITLAVALELTDPGEYSMVVGRTGGMVLVPLPGRGLVKGKPPLEFQTAFPVAGDTEAERTAALKNLIEQMAQGWSGPPARPIPMLPEVVPLDDLLPPGDAWPPPPDDGSLAVPVGLDVDDLEPVTVDLWDGPHFLITGPLESGKTTFLQTWLLALAERFSPEQLHLYLADFRRVGLFPLRRLPHVRAYVTDDDQLGDALAEISRALQERRQARDEARREVEGLLDERAFMARYPALVMAVDDLDTFKAEAQSSDLERLEQVIGERKLGFYLILAGASTDLSSAHEGWVRALMELQTGFLLGSSDDSQLLNLSLPYAEKNNLLPPGQGYYARRRRRHRKVKVATCHAGLVTLVKWVERIVNRKS